MAKVGLDYFPVDVDILSDRKLRKIKTKYGYLGFCVYFSLLTLIYKDKGYYLDYSDKDAVIWDVLEHLQGKYQPRAETIADVIEDLVACELFSGDHYHSKILTSKRVQETYYKATVDRKSIDVEDTIWLLSIEEMTKISGRSMILHKFINRSNCNENRSNPEENRPIFAESKVKYITTTTDAHARETEENVEKDVENCVENKIPDLEEIQGYFKQNGICGDPEKFYAYNKDKNPTFRDWHEYAVLWGRLEKHKSVAVKMKNKNQTCGFDLDEFFAAACLRGEDT